MGSIYLPEYIENARFYLKRRIQLLGSDLSEWEDIQEMTTAFRQHGVCSLFLYGTSDTFFINMMQSGGAFLHFLKRFPDDKKVTSHAKPFLDVVGAGYWECARDIAQNSRMSWAEGFEYEEDFLYVCFLMNFFFLGASRDHSRSILDEFDRARAGVEPERSAVCHAFLDHDNEMFVDALVQILQNRSDKVEKMIDSGTLPEEIWSWLRWFSTEGLALVRLAEKTGFQVNDTYRHVPDICRIEPPHAFFADAWRSLDYQP